jgi:hypothetical protein
LLHRSDLRRPRSMILRVVLYFLLMSGLTVREWLTPIRTR